MSNQDLLHPIYHLGKLNVSPDVPLGIINALFINEGLDTKTFSVYSLVDKDGIKITVFDYPPEMKQEEYKAFISTVQRELDILSKYFSELEVINVINSVKKSN